MYTSFVRKGDDNILQCPTETEGFLQCKCLRFVEQGGCRVGGKRPHEGSMQEPS